MPTVDNAQWRGVIQNAEQTNVPKQIQFELVAISSRHAITLHANGGIDSLVDKFY
jgi:hypothetical protein